jgi:hypothetical protein
MSTNQKGKTLTDLPNELTLNILEYFRLEDVDAIAWHGKDDKTYTRQEIRRREQTLWSLCLTTKRLSSLATPKLYSNIRSLWEPATDLPRFKQLFWTLVRKPQLATYISTIDTGERSW